MTIYSVMPLELVLDGIRQQPGPYLTVQAGDVRLQIEAVAPGIGRIVRLTDGPLDAYLRPELTPGTLVAYGATTS
ncbi:YlzJ-like family protein [Paenibacillus sp. MWE-103]|uniref:YlzJ-like family protein n=1 Tax=Paenibacillus artemisiicola TaxID=1172618 RepID=A0ABS3WE67_9BACL|nr:MULTISPECIES: YlzJ-like family protein [Paenibacillus]MBO7746594.1 YlzJ-like family protein [Paenibacillus artemisiicola]SFI52105.1 YlzJ-like protein [Paenibacillus sp. UNC496MF]